MASPATPCGMVKSACLSLLGIVSPHAVNIVVSWFDFSGNVESLRQKSKRLTDKQTDVRKKLIYLEKSQRMVRKTEVASWLHDVTKTNLDFVKLEIDLLVQQNKFMNPLLRGGQVLKFISRFDVLLQQHEDFHESYVIEAENTRGEPLLTTSLFGDALDKNVEIIWKYVVIDKIRIIGIYGMGGVGKTTLAKHIHNLLLEKTSYHVYWVTVSREFSINKLQVDIAKCINLDLSSESDEEKRAALLKKALSQIKDLVLILDDVWDHINLIKGGITEGCRLIITTRSLPVCRQIGCSKTISVETLDEDEAWNLFKKVLGQETTLAKDVEKIAKSVAEECDGLPLGIVTLAASMRSETQIYAWRNTLAELKEYRGITDMNEKVFGVLKYSFDRLDPSLQLCFLYCSLYPEDYEIEKNELISRFISEKLLEHRNRREAEFDLGHVTLDKLVNVCLLESIQLYDGLDGVKMHDLLRDMAIKITSDNPKFKVLAGLSLKEFPSEEEYWTEDLEKMSLMENEIREIPEGMSPNCQKLSTLLLNSNEKLTIIPDSFFSLMRGLSVLDLSWTSITVLPNSVCDLESLNVLDLTYCEHLVHVVNLGKLKALKELYLKDCHNIREVPQGLENLVNLKILSLFNTKLYMLPTGLLPKLQHLQYLFLPFHVQVVQEEIESLKQLEKVCYGVKDVYDFNSFVRSQQSGQGNITSYYIGIGDYGEELEQHFPSEEIDCKRVMVYGCNLKKGEGNEVTLLGQDIQHLELVYCEGLSSCFSDDLQRLGSPRSIHTLDLRGCKGIECIARLTTTQQEELNSLENIKLYHMPDLMGLVVGDATAIALTTAPPIGLFSSLKQLIIRGCHKIKKLGLLDLQNLEYISIDDCFEIEEIIQVVAEQGRGGVVSVSLPKLKGLYLDSLPKLKSICTEEAKMCCSSMEKISILYCPKVKKLPLLLLRSSSSVEYAGHHSSYSAPPNLKEIRTEEACWESLEWDDPTHKDILLPFCSLECQMFDPARVA